jgi:hypothetical protein
MGFITQGVGTATSIRHSATALMPFSESFAVFAWWYMGCSFTSTSQQNVVAWRCEAMSPESIRANEDVIRRVQGEYLEMPGLRLTPAQARRLWGLDAASCDALLMALVDAKFLFRTRDGAFMRMEQTASVKAALRNRNTIVAA